MYDQNFASTTIVKYSYSRWVILVFDMKSVPYSNRQMKDRPEMLSSEMGKINSAMPYWSQSHYWKLDVNSSSWKQTGMNHLKHLSFKIIVTLKIIKCNILWLDKFKHLEHINWTVEDFYIPFVKSCNSFTCLIEV